MRILFFFLVCLILSCEDRKSSKQNTTVAKDTTSVQDTPVNKPKTKREYPRLTDNNAMQFFMDYGKENTENKVRIVTDLVT